ncbi:hypothetical protein SAMN05192532_102222 [Alteribacillus iranensis]|uniref:Lumazine-binding n=2 Tax=Alteribacillus iranensis TaxID=930128 RepID=A0A1I2BCP3_9BACI|nr:hypothetical protein SAMN05192532_102222 [Alteribacillus iranensis]
MFAFFSLVRSPSEQAKNTVASFYDYEQEGDFAQSWDLFHSDMKNKFTKGHYIQDRAHVFMNHFDVSTFSYEIGEPEKLKEWQMEKNSTPLEEVYQVNVIQTFKGKYGNFDISQDVFAVKEDDEWTILWDYKK